METGTYNFTINKGATFSRVVTWKEADGDPIDLTGYTARMQVREYASAADPVIDLTTTNGGIALGGTAGTITLSISSTDTSNVGVDGGVYDLELVSAGGVVTRLLQGFIEFSDEVTR